MKTRSMPCLLFMIWAFFGCSCGPSRASSFAFETLRTNKFVSEDAFLAITNGSPIAEVRKGLGTAVTHEFTASDAGHTWTLIKCFLHTGEDEAYEWYELLFCDGALARTVGHVHLGLGKIETVRLRAGGNFERRGGWDIEDNPKGVREVINAPAVTSEQIRAELKDARETMKKYEGQGNIPAVVGYIFALPFALKSNSQYPINEKLRQKYDGCRASLGMRAKEIDALYGEPLCVFTSKAGRPARVYGDHRYLGMVDAFLRFPYVAVLFEKDGRAVGIYSDSFFCEDWDPVLLQKRKSTEVPETPTADAHQTNTTDGTEASPLTP